jgi:hypothetical protein
MTRDELVKALQDFPFDVPVWFSVGGVNVQIDRVIHDHGRQVLILDTLPEEIYEALMTFVQPFKEAARWAAPR